MTDLLEKDFTDNVVQLAKTLGWRVAHFRPARTKHGWATPMQGDKGFPDLVLAKQGRVVFAELKSRTGKPTVEQRDWLGALSRTDPESWKSALTGATSGHNGPMSFEVYVWRPDDIDQIGKVLGPNE
jgi:hypothetical protein